MKTIRIFKKQIEHVEKKKKLTYSLTAGFTWEIKTANQWWQP
jgi:hypothetical protein